jgi:hypothetical protein
VLFERVRTRVLSYMFSYFESPLYLVMLVFSSLYNEYHGLPYEASCSNISYKRACDGIKLYITLMYNIERIRGTIIPCIFAKNWFIYTQVTHMIFNTRFSRIVLTISQMNHEKSLHGAFT